MCFSLSITKTLYFNVSYMFTNVTLRHSSAHNGPPLYFGAEENGLTQYPVLEQTPCWVIGDIRAI